MSLIEKVKAGFWSHLGSAIAAAITALFGWIFYQLAPFLLPALEAVPVRVILAILLLSLLINLVLAFIAWQSSRPPQLRLMYGILWDKEKNPHCPVCRTAGLSYGNFEYGSGGGTYHCKSCDKLFPLVDASGGRLDPEAVLKRL